MPVRSLPPLLANYVIHWQEKGRELDKFLLNTRDTFLLIARLRDKNDILRQEQAQQRSFFQLLKALEIENAQLRKMLAFPRHAPYQLLPARVIALNTENWYSLLTIDRGQKDGVLKDQPVINEDGLVGKIAAVYPDHAQVLTVTSPQCKVSILDVDTGTLGVAIGRLHRPLQLNYVANTSRIDPLDRIITSGVSYTFPEGIMVGTVKSVKKEKYGMFQKVEVAPAVDFARLQYVFMIIGDKK